MPPKCRKCKCVNVTVPVVKRDGDGSANSAAVIMQDAHAFFKSRYRAEPFVNAQVPFKLRPANSSLDVKKHWLRPSGFHVVIHGHQQTRPAEPGAKAGDQIQNASIEKQSGHYFHHNPFHESFDHFSHCDNTALAMSF